MGRRTFEVSTEVPAAPEAVIDFLMDLEGHRGLHPFLSTAAVVDSGISPAGPWWDWSVVERPTLGPLRFPIRFPARMTRTSATSMSAVVRAAPGCWLRSSTHAEVADGACRLVEHTEVVAPALLLGYMSRQAEAAHSRTYSLLAGVL